MQKEDCYYLGTIYRRHGLKGHVLIKLDVDNPELYSKLESVFVDNHGLLVPFFIKQISLYKGDNLKVLFDEVEDVDSLMKRHLFLPLDSLPALSGKQFYFHEVIGFQISDENNTIGEIIEINDSGTQALFVVKNDLNKEIAIPIINDWIVEVNRDSQYIKMQLPEGILEL